MSKESDLGKEIAERTGPIKKALVEMLHDNPLLGRGPAEMKEVNARNVHYQDALREAMVASIMTGGDPFAAFTGAVTALSIALCAKREDEKAREAIGYLLGLVESIKHIEGGPLVLINGEMTVECMIKPGEVPSEEIRKHYGLPEEPVTAGGKIEVRREGNVVDASDMFAARSGSKTLH